MREAAGEEEKLLEKVHSAYREDSYPGAKESCTLPLSARPGEDKPCYSQKCKGKGEGATATGSIEGIFYQQKKKRFSQLKLVSQAPLSGEPTDLQQCRSCSPAWTSPESRGPARLTSQGHFQPRGFQDSRQALTSGDAHKGRKKLTWQLRNQPLFIFSQT